MNEHSPPASGAPSKDADVCIIVEGCYPYVPGGVSSWIDWLIRSQPDTTFSIVALWPRPTAQPPRYTLPGNVIEFRHVFLQDFGAAPRTRSAMPPGIAEFGQALTRLTTEGGVEALWDVTTRLREIKKHIPLPVLFNSPVAWRLVQDMYAAEMPYGSFLHYFWAWRALLGGLFATLEFELPRARVYHTISTGYAGVLAARAAIETGRPSLLTEHGIYTNERRVELLMADWVTDIVDKGHMLDDPRFDLRDMWVRAFEAYARTCYEASTEVVTLYQDNQRLQKALGADTGKLRVIANGIDVRKFAGLPRAGPTDRPTMALIGRVVPIKDIQTFIAAARLVRERIPDVRAWIMGPTDEDEDYFAACRELVARLGLGHTVQFTGAVNIVEYLPQVHVAVLTSLSESQPLVVLEAGAAGVPFVATNAGSCREIIEGRSDEVPPFGPGGIVTDLVAPDQIAAAIVGLLGDHHRRETYGDALRARVETYYTSERAAGAYTSLYRRLVLTPSWGVMREDA
ncbi:MAG: GT4 family glycosyltransferase PelF [Hyphomicrobium sp.]